jgi:hypothetical protein
MSEGKKVRWSIASARQHFPTLVDLAAREPQDIYRRDELVAQVVPAGASLTRPPPPTAREMLAELHRICVEEDYELPVSPRVDRPNAMVRALAEPRKQRAKKRTSQKRRPR